MTLTKFMARSTWVAHAFEWEKLLKCHLKGKASKKLANGQNIDYSEKRKRPKGFICPCTGVKYHNIQTCLLVYAADSGERLQDHWSSGFCGYEVLRFCFHMNFCCNLQFCNNLVSQIFLSCLSHQNISQNENRTKKMGLLIKVSSMLGQFDMHWKSFNIMFKAAFKYIKCFKKDV